MPGRTRQRAGVAGAVDRAFVVDAVLAQQPVEQWHELVEAVDPLLERALLTENAGVEVAAGAEATQEAPVGEVVEVDGRLALTVEHHGDHRAVALELDAVHPGRLRGPDGSEGAPTMPVCRPADAPTPPRAGQHCPRGRPTPRVSTAPRAARPCATPSRSSAPGHRAEASR